MPNYCWNSITIYKEDIKLLEELKSKFENNSFNYSIDYYKNLFPADYILPDIEIHDIYSVSSTFGSKWFDLSSCYIEEDNTLILNGDSAWGPIVPLVKMLSEAYQCNTSIYYEEPGCDFGGKAEYNCGEIVEELHTTYLHIRYIDDGLEAIYNEFQEGFISCERLAEISEFVSDEDFEEILNNYKDVQN
jgi:hypothetical protein